MYSEIAQAIATPSMVSVWDATRPSLLPKNLVPNRPASAEAANGANGTARSRLGLSCPAMMILVVYLVFGNGAQTVSPAAHHALSP